MEATRWSTLEALFDEGVALEPAARAHWLQSLDVEPDLREELRAMLAADAEDSGRADRPRGDPHAGGRLTRRFGAAVAGATEVPLSGQQLGAYRLLGELGSGGAGVVFLGERADAQFTQQVAIKVIRGIASADAARQLRHERQLLAGFDHPGIARLFDGGETAQGQPYLVMEYVRGEPLTQACRARGVRVRERIALLAEVAHAVHYAHQRLVIHRDIKPANVLLREDGRPVLLDFGIAKLLGGDGGGEGGTAVDATQPWFTPAYASPEQRRGEPVSTATDVYALGLLLHELLTDLQPAADAEGRVPAPSRLVAGRRAARVRGDLDRIVLRATAPEPARRYPSAEALAEDLQRYLDGHPVLAAPDRLTYRAGKLLRRHPIGAVAVLATCVVLALLGWRLANERDRALAAEAVAQRESQAAEAVTGFLVDLFGEADPSSARGARMTPAELVDRGVERLQQRAELPPRQRARLLATLGELYNNLGLPVKATATLEAAQAAAAQAAAPPSERVVYLSLLGTALENRADYGGAETVFRDALVQAHAAGDADRVALLQADLALMLSRQGKTSVAEPLLRDALALREAHFGHDSVEAAEAEVFLAELLRTEGRHAEAQPLMDEAVGHMRERLAVDHPDLLAALSFQAELLRELGDTAAAERVLLEILEHRASMLDSNSEKIALVHSALGSVYYEQGRTREATAQFVATLEIGERTFAADDPTFAIDLNNVASLFEEMGDYVAAEPLFRRALAVIETHAADHAPRLAQFRQNLGRLLMFAGAAEESHRLLSMPVPDGDVAELAMQRGRQHLHLAEWHRRYGSAADAQVWLQRLEDGIDDIGGRAVPRYAQALRTRGLLALQRGDVAAARADLQQARELLVAGRGAGYVGVGELALDLASLELDAGNRADAARWGVEARRLLSPVVAAHSPQAAALAALEGRLAAAR